MTPTENGWHEWQRHVLAEMTRLADGQVRLERSIVAFGERVTRVEERIAVRATAWGAVGALAIVLVAKFVAGR
jgi:uncharacterized YccA/Bax inhibitor family protein